MNKKKIVRAVLAALLALILVVGGYVAYVLLSYYRQPDNLELAVTGTAGADAVPVGRELTAMSWNIGFAAYTPDFGFFMDGGTESRAKSADSVREVLAGVADLVRRQDPDLLLLQEVDCGSTRSWQIDQAAELTAALGENRSAAYAMNYDSPYLFWPLTEPHGASRSGMLTLSRYGITGAVRRSLPIEETLMKLVDLDRCYAVHRVPTDNGRELVIYALHLSAYTSDGTIATRQLELLLADMAAEYAKGNYALAGGDFNKDLLGDSSAHFGISGEAYTWAQAFPAEMLAGTGISLVAPLDESAPVPSCRNADGPYHAGQFVLTVDGFLVSDNLTVTADSVLDTGFRWSDHQPVTMTFRLEP